MDNKKALHESIGFVLACVFSKAITIEEMQQWADYVLVRQDTFPPWLAELSVYSDSLAHIYRTIGYPIPYWHDQTPIGEAGLIAIAFIRGTVDKVELLERLEPDECGESEDSQHNLLFQTVRNAVQKANDNDETLGIMRDVLSQSAVIEEFHNTFPFITVS